MKQIVMIDKGDIKSTCEGVNNCIESMYSSGYHIYKLHAIPNDSRPIIMIEYEDKKEYPEG